MLISTSSIRGGLPRVLACFCLATIFWPGPGVGQSARQGGAESGASRPVRTLTVADAVQTTRILSVSISPDGRRYALVMVRADLQRNGNWFEFLVGELGSMERARRPREVARLFTRSWGSRYDFGAAWLTLPGHNQIQWLPDSRGIALLFASADEPVQITTVDVETGDIRQLTRSARSVTGFTVSTTGTVVYEALVPHDGDRSRQRLRDGFVVPDRAGLFDVLRGDVDGYSMFDRMYNTQRFVTSINGGQARRIETNSEGMDRFTSVFRTEFSPDGRSFIIDGTRDPDPAWSGYTDPFFSQMMASVARVGRQGLARQIKSLFIVDASDGSARPLWPAPLRNGATRAAWSPDGLSILLGPTYLPIAAADEIGRAGNAYVVVNARTGEFRRLPVSAIRGRPQLGWLSPDRVEISGSGGSVSRFVRVGDDWRASDVHQDSNAPAPGSTINLEVRQDANTPPAVYAIENGTGRAELIVRPNPDLGSSTALGRVSEFRWRDRRAVEWTGMLYHPVNFVEGRRYPLVIQTHGHAGLNQFSLYGSGGGRGMGPVGLPYAAQVLAGRGMFVLQVEDKALAGADGTPLEPVVYMVGYEGAVDALATRGLVDRERVGLVGFSRTGYHVLYALAHSEFRFAAALASDNIDGSYVQHLLGSESGEGLNGAPASGDGLRNWIQTAPGFNIYRIRTPLRLETQNYQLMGVLQGWEIFAGLRRLNRPVEYFVIPDPEHGAHGVQNPAQVLAVQEGAVDWFNFWLQGAEDPVPAKAEQYARWRRMRDRACSDAGRDDALWYCRR